VTSPEFGLVKECTIHGPHAAQGKPACGPPHPTQNVLIYVINSFSLAFSVFQLKVGYKRKMYDRINKMSAAGSEAPLSRGFATGHLWGTDPR